MRTVVTLFIASLLFGCAATTGSEYAKVYDRKYNEYRLVKQESPGSFVGTSAATQRNAPPRQHP